MDATLYALQGVFFQRNFDMGTGYDPEIGIRATISERMNFSMFHAVLGKEPGDESFSGTMSDRYGEAAITDFSMTETEMSFNKGYTKRKDIIRYVFTEKKGGIWYGTWSGPAVGKGTAKCIVNEITESFLQPVNADDVEKLMEAH